ncbi:MAG: TRIC cation channel family protein [Verrucomicrobia bacterium]|nr:TRIC cation channel family protein [Verrucomicrobiota bacterium]
MNYEAFYLPIGFDLAATFLFGLTGALVAIRRSYDIVGISALAIVCGVGGGVIRDGIFIQMGRCGRMDPRYLYCLIGSILVGIALGERIQRFGRMVALFDAAGLGAYAVFGTQKSLAAGLSPQVAILVGVINACGGGLLRDIIMREEPLVFKPGQFYVVAALIGAATFVFAVEVLDLPPLSSGFFCVFLTFVIRYLAIRFNWITKSFYAPQANP